MRFIRTKDVLRMLGVSRTTLWRMVRAGAFPRRVTISARASGHVLEEVEAWMAERAVRTLARVDLLAAQAAHQDDTPELGTSVGSRRRRGRG